jgi:hypothetical protein
VSKPHESGHWHPERWRRNPVRVRRYLLHLRRAAHSAARELVGFHFANLLHGHLSASYDATESARLLHEQGVRTLGEVSMLDSDSHEKPQPRSA